MRKIAAILLLSLLLFNFLGYRMLSACLENQAHADLVSSLDKQQYNKDDLVSIKVPSNHLSSYANTGSFQRVNGAIEIYGVQYNYVAIRLENDSVEMLCIPNYTATTIKSAKNEFFKLISDLQPQGQGKRTDSHSGSVKNAISDYESVNLLFALNASSGEPVKAFAHYSFSLPAAAVSTNGQPPEIC